MLWSARRAYTAFLCYRDEFILPHSILESKCRQNRLNSAPKSLFMNFENHISGIMIITIRDF